MLEYDCGLILGFALISNENPNSEMACATTAYIIFLEKYARPISTLNFLHQITTLS